jgi:hypothetical protein
MARSKAGQKSDLSNLADSLSEGGGCYVWREGPESPIGAPGTLGPTVWPALIQITDHLQDGGKGALVDSHRRAGQGQEFRSI